MPDRWRRFQLKHLINSAGDFPIISISKDPMDLGTNLIQDEPLSYWNIYKQILRGSKLAKTDFIGIAEDDTLYTREHFTEFRPDKDSAAYDMSRWSLFSWEPMYSVIRRHGNFSMIAPTKLVVEALSEREEKYPNGNSYTGEIGRNRVEKNLGVTRRKLVEFYSTNPIVNLTHDYGIDNRKDIPKGYVKKRGELKAYDIPYWGKAEDILKEYHEN